MKTFARYAALIGATTVLTIVVAVAILGTPSVGAQNPPPAPAGSATAAPAGSATPEASTPAPAGSATDGSAAAPAPAPAGSAAGSAAPAPAGSAAPAAPAAGAAPAAPAAAAKPEDVRCATGEPAPMGPVGKNLKWYERLRLCPIDEGGNFWMPKAVNLEADSTDQMFYAVWALSVVFFVAILIAVVYLVWKYRHRPGHKAEPSSSHNDALEITWTVIPTIICVFLFYYGWRTYIRVVTPPQKALEINVIASQWHWDFVHPEGVTDSNDLHVPVDTPVRLVMTSKDVLHAFYAPVMRVKQDIVPRRYTYAWFHATKPGTYRLTCAEYCGTDHSQMSVDPETGRRAVVVVHRKGDYERYLAEKKAEQSNEPVGAPRGKKVWQAKGCNQCHSIDGKPGTGPTWKGIWGETIETEEGPVVVDESYIKESILVPTAKTVKGFGKGTMSSYAGQVTEGDILSVIAFIESLK